MALHTNIIQHHQQQLIDTEFKKNFFDIFDRSQISKIRKLKIQEMFFQRKKNRSSLGRSLLWPLCNSFMT